MMSEKEKNLEEVEETNEEITVEDLVKETERLKKENEKYYEHLQRTAAEFDNYKKRTNKEKLLMHSQGVEETVLAILPVLDDFERAFEHNELAEGGKLIYKKLVSTLENFGIEKIHIDEETKFDVDEHEAISVTGDSGVVSQVVLPGYKFNGKVIRYAKVIVA